MENVGIYTCANDAMLPFLRVWLAAMKRHEPAKAIAIIPFDDQSEATEAFAREHAIPVLPEAAKQWRAIGRALYGNKMYRKGTPAAHYFSKLASFSGPFDEFIFMDANAILCTPFLDIFDRFQRSGLDIAFRFRASPGRNIATLKECGRLNKLNPNIQNGFNANFFISKRGVILPNDASNIDDAEGAFGKAPEQSLLTRILAEKGLAVDTIHQVMRYPIGASCRELLLTQGENVVFPSRAPVMFVKWNGAKIDESMPNYEIFQHIVKYLPKFD
ncbi:hypothetical protein [Acuticoccus sediminis]|uniref:hypothetical protein n=1 Tax=Acuticoccus sediminis TaxID=2184697 RepID=UPI001CFEE33E|nr:hypothetical protein [Acuticoccus sediminis]